MSKNAAPNPAPILTLTPSQLHLHNQLRSAINNFRMVVVRGERQSGKRTVVDRWLKDQVSYVVRTVDLYAICSKLQHRLSGQDLVDYLSQEAQQLLTPSEPDRKSQRSPSNLRGIFYFPRIERMFDVLADYQSENRNLAMVILTQFIERYPRITVLVTTTVWRPDITIDHCTLELQTTRDDLAVVLRNYFHPGQEAIIEQLLRVAKIQQPGQVAHCQKVATLLEDEHHSFIDLYRKEFSRLTGSTLDPQKNVEPVEPKIHLVGMDPLLTEIEQGIIGPIERNHPMVPVKKGIILYGPPGTGKTSIGRWLAHRLGGKLFLVGGEHGISGQSFIEAIDNAVTQAGRSSPAVVFVDDADLIFEQPDSYRALLTILDGLDNKKRNGVCVIVTCMEISRVPASLLRGGRLEMALKVDLPTPDVVRIILQNGLERLLATLRELSPEQGRQIKPLNEEQLQRMVHRMVHRMYHWNCADLHRVIDDTLRELLATPEKIDLEGTLDKAIQKIREQYRLCDQSLLRRHEEYNYYS